MKSSGPACPSANSPASRIQPGRSPWHRGFPHAPLFATTILCGISALTSAMGQATFTWTGGEPSPTGDPNWTNPANWTTSGGGSALPQGTVIFTGNTQLNSNNDFGNYSAGFQIIFDAAAGAFTLTGNPIIFYDFGGQTPTIRNDSTTLQTIGFEVDLSHSSTDIIANTGLLDFTSANLYINNSGTLNASANPGQVITFYSSIRNPGANVTIGGNIGPSSGSGLVIYRGSTANNYSGMTTVHGGELQLDKPAGTIAIPGNITLGNGTGSDIIKLFASDQIADTSVVSLNGNAVNNRGVLRLNNCNETIGGLSSTGVAGDPGAGAGLVENSSGAAGTSYLTLDVAAGSQSSAALIRNNFIDNSAANGVLALAKTGVGTQILTYNNSYSGTTHVNGGKLVIAGNQTGGGEIVVFNDAILEFGNGSTTDGSVDNAGIIWVNGTGTVRLNKADGGVLSNQVASNPGCSITLGGTNAPGTTNTFTATAFNNEFGGNNGALSTHSANAGATLAFSNPDAIDIKGSTLNVGGAGDTLFIGRIYNSSGVGSVVKSGGGTLIYRAANTYTGPTSVNEGTLALESGGVTSAITVADGALLGFTLGSTVTSTQAITLDTGAKIRITGTPVLPSYTLTTTAGITGTPVLESPIAGYVLVVDGTTLKLNASGGNYASWANDPLKGNIPGEPATGDFDNDGLDNLTEYALGLDPRVSSQPPGTFDGTILSFTKGTDAIANGDVSYVIEQSTTLSGWTPVVTQSAPNASTTITHTLPTGLPEVFARLKITQP